MQPKNEESFAVTHLYLIRHGNNIDGLEDGKDRDLGLSPQGFRQSERLRDRLVRTGEIKPDVFIFSPDEFMERTRQIPKGQEAYYPWVKGYENRLEFSLQVHLALNRILQEHTGKTIVLLTHGAFLQNSFGFFFGHAEANLERAAPEVAKTSISHWRTSQDGNRWILERSNDYHHLL